ncbi:MAG: hypothetical protein AB8D78_09095 [Akkermansiaceae bacterium]
MQILLSFLTAFFVLAGSVSQAQDGEFPTPEAQMQKWYAAHMKGAGPFLDEKQREFWDFMFGEALVKQLKKKERGFDPFYFAQDAEIKNLKITRIPNGEKPFALVLVSFNNFGKQMNLIAYMEVTDAGWKLINMVNPEDGTSLVRDLSQ